MLNLAGSEFDFGPVLYAVLEECEHKRRSLAPEETAAGLREIAREKLEEIGRSYAECGGTAPYWALLTREVLDTALPQYVEAAVEKNRLERASYDLWRRGDPLSRAALGLAGLSVGGIMVKLPFIPVWEDWFAFALGFACFFYPELKRMFFDFRHYRTLNRLITRANRYQKDQHPTTAELEELLHPHALPHEHTHAHAAPHTVDGEAAAKAAAPDQAAAAATQDRGGAEGG